jgi:K+/H+ antiporter YhaU regulatory subunit KhtT
MSPRTASLMARYEEIALDVAEKIVRGEYRIGDRLVGRSSLAGQYKVSPETIRRAIAVLHSHTIVTTKPGLGIIVVDREAARRYVEEAELTVKLRGLQEEVMSLLEERRRLDERLAAAISKMVHSTVGAIATMRHVEEIEVAAESELPGTTLQEADIRTRTGATIVGVVRGREEIFSPPPSFRLESGDVLIVVGNDEAKDRLRRLAQSRAGAQSGEGEGSRGEAGALSG